MYGILYVEDKNQLLIQGSYQKSKNVSTLFFPECTGVLCFLIWALDQKIFLFGRQKIVRAKIPLFSTAARTPSCPLPLMAAIVILSTHPL